MKNIPGLQTTDTIGKAVDELLNGQCKNFLVMDGDTPAGTLNRDAIIKALQKWGNDALLDSAMDTNLGYIDAAEPAEKAFVLMQQYKYPLLIVTKAKQLYGTVDMENILEFIMVINALPAKESR